MQYGWISKAYAKGKMSDTNTTYCLIPLIMTFWKNQNYRNRSQFTNDQKELLGVIELFSILIIVVDTQVYIFVKIHRTVYLK